MFRIPLPKWAHYIAIEYDGTVWAYRYKPKVKDEIRKAEDGSINVRTTQHHNGTQAIIAVIDPKRVKPCTIKVPAIINNMAAWFDASQTITTKSGQDYKEYTFEQYLLSEEKENNEAKSNTPYGRKK